MKLSLVCLWIVSMQLASCQPEHLIPPAGKISKPIKTCTGKRTDDPTTISILFVGNSLTYSNDLPGLVEALGTKNNKSILTEMLAYPNYALEDHWNEGKIQQLICEQSFDFVVVQQGPSSQADGRQMLLEYGALIKTWCDSRDTKLAFFMVWPAITNYHTFEGVINNYTYAARETESILCPVGASWKEYIDTHNNYSYYSADGFHPSWKGSEQAAAIIYDSLINN